MEPWKLHEAMCEMPSPSEACSAGSADSTTASPDPDSNTSSSASPTSGDAPCSPGIGPAFPSTTTYDKWASETGDGWWTEKLPHLRAQEGGVPSNLIFSAAASPAKTSASPDNDVASPENAADSFTSSPASSTLFDPDGFSSRTYPGSSVRTAVGTSESCLERWPTSGTAWHGGFSTAVSSECRSDADGCSSSDPSLTMILEPPQDVPARYSLSARAARGILRRAEKRGRTLPTHLQTALEAVA